ncbi:hypothetical protein SAMN05444366_0827 [Flavobacterium saccharophilum]|uniref:Uncharacterized protein n=1 Tax=Flavobacterium saccharophilum TaxID=29534 RepID=A0A1M7AVZ5_9FLAO|nr:hypothetical protein SAMN05444366_0827 [Flavobacterium saccharophilum]
MCQLDNVSIRKLDNSWIENITLSLYQISNFPIILTIYIII